MIRPIGLFLTAFTALSSGLVLPAAAQSSDQRVDAIEHQIQTLQQDLQRVRRELTARDAKVKAAQAQADAARQQADAARQQAELATKAAAAQPAPAALPTAAEQAGASPSHPVMVTTTGNGRVQIGGVTVQLGGFVEVAGAFRSRNESTDIASSFAGIPFNNTASAHQSEVRGTARQSRLSLLVQGNVSDTETVTGYYETDFLGGAPTANSNQSNSYTPRLRQAFLSLDDSATGMHILGGQAWSLLTLTKSGITARTELAPPTIDAQPVPGFTWARQPQIRVADQVSNQVWLAASLEAPQAVFTSTTLPSGATVTADSAGTGTYPSTSTYSSNVAPDIIVKAAFEPGFGHFEAEGVMRFLNDRVSTLGQGSNNNTIAGGGGVGMYVPLIPGKLELQGSVLAGVGIGRYGSAGLPDATVSANGAPAPIPEVQALIGLTGHVTPVVDIYGFAGTEQESKKAFTVGGKGYGYGSPLYSNVGCNVELSTASCTANTSGVVQGTVGGWWKLMHGSFGTVQTGVQYSYTRRTTFNGIGGAPKADENIVMVSLRYFPFQ